MCNYIAYNRFCKLRFIHLYLYALLQFATFVRSSSVTMAIVFLVVICAMDIVHAVMEATNETAVSLRKNCMTLTRYWNAIA